MLAARQINALGIIKMYSTPLIEQGLETIELLTLKQAYELRVDMDDFEGRTAFDHYTSFSISNE